jgi:hypothetical protein
MLDGRMVNTRNVRNGAENSQENGNPPPPPSLAQAIASILEFRDEQTEVLRQLVANSTRGGNGARNAPASAPTTYCTRGFKCFSIVLNFKNYFKLQKFIETCRNVQKLQNKFCINPLEPLFTVGSTKLTFTQ